MGKQSVFSKSLLFVCLCCRAMLVWIGWVPYGRRTSAAGTTGPIKPDWASLRTYPVSAMAARRQVWHLTHWGVYSVPAMGANGTWYAHNVYCHPRLSRKKVS